MRVLLVALAVIWFPCPALSQWRVVESLDPMTDENTSFAEIAAVDGDGQLFVRCGGREDESFQMFVSFDDYMGNGFKDVGFRYRIDATPVSRWVWVDPSTEGTSLIVRGYETWDIIKKMVPGETMLVEGLDFHGTAHRIRFDLTGASEAFEQLGCVRPPQHYLIPLDDPDDVLGGLRKYPQWWMTVGCYEGLLVRFVAPGPVRVTAGAEGKDFPGLAGDRASPADTRWLVEHLEAGRAVTVGHRSADGIEINAAGEHAVNIGETTAACHEWRSAFEREAEQRERGALAGQRREMEQGGLDREVERARRERQREIIQDQQMLREE